MEQYDLEPACVAVKREAEEIVLANLARSAKEEPVVGRRERGGTHAAILAPLSRVMTRGIRQRKWRYWRCTRSRRINPDTGQRCRGELTPRLPSMAEGVSAI